MPEELYTSRDFCELAEQFEELKRENEELVSDKMHLINAAMDGVDKYRYTAHDIAYRDLERKCEALEADYVISNRELLIKQVEINRQSARIAELEAENDRLQDGWFRDETICPDGSLRPKVSDLLNRIAELSQAVGLITTMKPTMVMDANHPLDMVREVAEHVTARIAELEAELTELKERFDITDGLLNQATVSIGAVIACCTYNSNAEAMAGAYGISYRAFTMIDNFIKNYNHAVSAGKVSVDVKRELTDAEIEELGAQEAERKEFCPNCEAETPCTHEAELFVCDICGEDFAKYIVSRYCNVSDVSMTQDVLTDIKTSRSIEIEDLETVVEHLKIRLSEWQGVARQLADELVEANSERLPVSWEEPGETSRAMIAYRNLVDIEDMEANDAKQRS